MLPKPMMIVTPSAVSPIGIDLGACNSENACQANKCDITDGRGNENQNDDFHFISSIISVILSTVKKIFL